MSEQNYIIGSVSHGTMRPEDLIPCFVDVAREFKLSGREEVLLKEIEYRMEQSIYYESEEADWDLDELFTLLGKYAPPYFCFGSHPGDGADYGFWLCDDVAEMVTGSGGYATEDLEKTLEEIKKEYSGGCVEILYSNDHGNLTLYTYYIGTDELKEIWAIV